MWALLAVCIIVPVVLVVVAVRSGDEKNPETTVRTPASNLGLLARNAVRPGDVAPTFRLAGLDGGTIDTARYAGKPYVLTFWASWCQPCRKEMPLLQRASKDVQVVGVTFQDPASESRAFARKYGITFPLAPDDGIRVAHAYGVVNVPVAFVIGADGKVVRRLAGNGDTKELSAALRSLPS
jgi:cytochrome c biogenesis protein CcmG/thiol:disulfide interchange protein DsbE